MTRNKFLSYAAVPMVALSLAGGASLASAHGFGFFGQNVTPQQIAEKQTTMFEQQANLLGVSVDEIKNAWAEGKSLQQLATEKGISQEQLKTKIQQQMQAKMKAHLQALVDQGVITQDQMNKRLQFMQNSTTNFKIKGFGRGGMGMMMGL